VDQLDASGSEYAFYIINTKGTNSGEGSRLDILGVNWRGGDTPTMTSYFGSGNGGTVGRDVYFSAAIVDGQMQLTCNVPTDNWSVKGTRISFENISFENVLGPLPTGGTAGQYLRKISSTDFEAEWANVAMSEIAGLDTALINLATDIATAQSTIDTHAARTDNPHSTTKSQVGLSNVDNTSDINKPVSTAQQNALDLKQDIITGAASTVVSSDLASDQLLKSNSSGKISVSGITINDISALLDTSTRVTETLISTVMSLALKEIIADNETKTATAGAYGSRIYVIQFSASNANSLVSITYGGDTMNIITGVGATAATKNWINSTDTPGMPTEVSSGAIAGAMFIPVGAGATINITSGVASKTRIVYVDLTA
jgi:hypothetical protein